MPRRRLTRYRRKKARSTGHTRRRTRVRVAHRTLQKGGTNEAQTETPLAVIVEPRTHKALPFVLRNFHENLPTDWQILILHSTSNKDFVEKTVAELSPPASRFRLRSLGVPSLTYQEYNILLKTAAFYEKYIPAETFMIFQTDSMTCGPHKDLLQKFMSYDYVGAPWKDGYTNAVGNGGLSLRKRSAILAKLRACPADKKENEDGYFAADCDAVKLKRPTKEEAAEFSIETMYHPKSFGVHKPWPYLMPHELSMLETQCPGVMTLQSLQGE
jgi:hypothetical protein